MEESSNSRSEDDTRAMALVEEILFEPPGRAPREDLKLRVVRPLTEADVPALRTGVASPPPSIVQIRNSHHQLARVLAGGASPEEASLITGYSPSRIASLRRDDAFSSLVEHYKGQENLALADLLGRLRVLSTSAMDELLRRLEDEPEKWTRRELMDLAEMGANTIPTDTSGARNPSAGIPPGGLNININFVKPSPRELPGETIEGEVSR